MNQFTLKQITDMFEYLDNLRESGVVNMFGAGPFVENRFGLTRNVARTVMLSWMTTFDPKVKPVVRATGVYSDEAKKASTA